MFSNFKYFSKLVGTLVLASFCFFQTGLGQALELRYDAGRLIILVKTEIIKKELETQKLELARVAQVFLNNPAATPDLPAILGNYTYTNGEIWFKPILSFQSGKVYYVLDQDKQVYSIAIPEKDHLQPKVVAVYPSADTLPANQLKFYLHFNVPMSEGKAYTRVKLVKNDLDTLVFPFVRLEPELWNREKTRLTLWLDPGRVKRDLNPNRELGAPLVEGFEYKLIIEPEWEDQESQALATLFIKKFYVSKDDRKKPAPGNWKIITPQAGTKVPLQIHFGESIDHALASRVIEVFNALQTSIAGQISFQNKERILSFIPDQAWQSGQFRIRIGAELEDLAGNNLNRLFDVDLQKEADEVANERFYWLSFQVKE